MTDEARGHASDPHDRSYEPPTISSLGSVDAFTQGDNKISIDSDDGTTTI